LRWNAAPARPAGRGAPPDSDVGISAIAAAEVLVGVEPADAPSHPREAIIEGIINRAEIVAYNLEVARHHASLLAHVPRGGKQRGAHDLRSQRRPARPT
jgi:tRNA(fMet)-specific endonuclease VapC